MQRIALCGCLAVVMLAAGCQGPSGRVELGPPPGPVLSTRPPPVIEAIPPPARPTREPVPRPEARGTSVTAADVRVPGGIQRGRWQIIVVHHSASDTATPQGMDSWHRHLGWAGLGYHFVIGNGTGYPDGQLFVGSRWTDQQTGAHCKASAGRYLGVWRPGNFFNERGIGICLIGDFDQGRPTARQWQTLRDLIAVLISEADISPNQIYGHGEITHRTACPGRNLHMDALRRAVAAAVYESPTAAGMGR